MSTQGQSLASAPRLLVLLALACLTVCHRQAMADESSANSATMNFGPGGSIRLSLKVGTVEVVGVPNERITVSWHSKLPEDEHDVSVKQNSDGKNATIMVDGPGNRVHYRIEVPRQSNVTIRMQAGELDVRGILGGLDVDLLAGDMDLRVAEPQHYHTVAASVTAGALTARPWRADTAGLWRSLRASGDGEYDLRARLLAGQLTIRSE
jgi:hypothetical protein